MRRRPERPSHGCRRELPPRCLEGSSSLQLFCGVDRVLRGIRWISAPEAARQFTGLALSDSAAERSCCPNRAAPRLFRRRLRRRGVDVALDPHLNFLVDLARVTPRRIDGRPNDHADVAALLEHAAPWPEIAR